MIQNMYKLIKNKKIVKEYLYKLKEIKKKKIFDF